MNIKFLLAVGTLLWLSGCKKKEVSPYLLVMVADEGTYNDCHIDDPNSRLVDLEKLDAFLQGIDKKTELIFYCNNYLCSSSGFAARAAHKKGYKVYAFEAGIADWYQKSQKDPSYKYKGDCTKPYLKRALEKPEHETQEYPVITTEALKNKIDEYRASQKHTNKA